MSLAGLDDLLPQTTHSPEETMALGARMAERFRPGHIVALYGELGAGKTHLVKGIATALGIPSEAVTSPTFTLLNEYAGRELEVYHFDAYRIKSTDEFYELGFEEYFFGDGLCLIEWPERVEPLLPSGTLRIRLAHVEGDRRTVEVLPDAEDGQGA